MRFCRSRSRLTLFIVAHTVIVCSRILIPCVAEYSNSFKLSDLQWRRQNAKFYATPDDFTFLVHKIAPTLERRRRQTANADFTWKVTKTPKFVTAKTEKSVEPILRVYPSDVAYRGGRSRELVASQRNIGGTGTGTGTKRVVYYATLPEVVRYSPNALPAAGERYIGNHPVTNQQRSFAPSKGGKEFVTRVQSSIIDVRPRGDHKKDIGATPTFTIIDANPTPYSSYPPSPYHRIYQADYNLIGSLDKQNFGNHVPPPYYHNHPKSQYELLPSPNPMKAYYANPYYSSNVDKSQYQINHLHYQQQQQASPYFNGDIGKVSSPYYSPPYPSRHTRFPIDRYPVTSPLGLGHLDIAIPPNTSPPLSESHLDLNNANYHSYQPNLGFDGPSPTFPPSSHSSNNLDFNNNFGSSLDHGLDFDDHHNASPLKDKFLDYNSLSQKYLDLNGFGHDFPFKYDQKDSFKFDKEPFRGPFSQVSDWLTSKPFDLSSLDFDDPSGNRDYQIKGSAHSVVVDSQTQMHNQNITTSSNQNDSNNTVITPFTSTNNTNTNIISQDEDTKREY